MKPLILHSDAEAELREAVDYYESQCPGLGLNFEAQVRQAFRQMQQWPALGPVHKQTRLRKFFVNRFPYIVFYRELDEHIWIIAVAHSHRRPNYWRNRAKAQH